jgi:hypothetical protein
MPQMCFSYPPGIGSRGAVPPVRGSKICFSYLADVPQGIEPVRDSRLCFSYQADVPLGIGGRGAVQPPPDSKLCFSYPATNCFRN